MDPSERLTDIFDRALQHGVESLSSDERRLYLIQDFIIEFEMNGLSGYLYNRLPQFDLIRETIDAMTQHRLERLAELLSQAAAMFAEPRLLDDSSSWSKILKRCDPDDRLHDLDQSIVELDDYGLREAHI